MTANHHHSRERAVRPLERRRSVLPFVLLACALCAPVTASADAPRGATPEAAAKAKAKANANRDNGLIWAARACYLEATWRESDCIALLYVVRKRAERVNRDWLDVLRDYSALFAKNPRAKEVRTFPWGDVAGKSEAWNERWQRLRQLVVEFASGQHEDPCPRAEHWGGRMDKPRGRMIKARCAARTANTFYAVTKQ